MTTVSRSVRNWATVVVVVAVIAAAGVVGLPRLRGSAAQVQPPAAGKLTVDTRPAGADVRIDGERRGTAPLSLMLPAGPHTLSVLRGVDERIVSVQITAGSDLTERIDIRPADKERAAAVEVPRPTPAEVSRPRESGAAPVGGWLALTAPFEIQVLERNEVVGTSAAPKFMLAAGRHDLVLANDALGYRETRRLDVAPGKTATVRVEAPRTVLSLNAVPWADVTIDEVSLGQTPIANATVTIGRHQVVFRHPTLGERTQTITATQQGPNRFSVDLRK